MLANRLRMATAAAAAGVTFIDSATTVNTTAGASLVISKPTGTIDGDLMVAVMSSAVDGSSWTGDTGWTEVFDQAALAPRLRVAYKIAASEGSSYTFTISSALAIPGGTIATFRNAAYDTIGSMVTATGTASVVAPSVTAFGGLLLAIYGRNNGVSNTFTTPAWMSQVVLYNTATNNASGVIFSETVAAGATGSRTSSSTVASGTTAGILLSLRPADAPITVNYIGSTLDINNLTSYTFSNVNIGAASTNRVLIIGVSAYANANGVITGLTVDGNAATVLSKSAGNATYQTAEFGSIFAYPLATGTTATIVANFDSVFSACHISVWTVDALGYSFEAVNGLWLDSAAIKTKSYTFANVYAGDVIISAARTRSALNGTWSTTNITKDIDDITESGISGAVGGSIAISTDASNYTVTYTTSSSTPNYSISPAIVRLYR